MLLGNDSRVTISRGWRDYELAEGIAMSAVASSVGGGVAQTNAGSTQVPVPQPDLPKCVATPAGTDKKLIEQPRLLRKVYIDDSTVEVLPLEPRDGQYAMLYVYHSCKNEPENEKAGQERPFEEVALGGKLRYPSTEVSPRVLQLDDKLKEKDTVCVKEYFYCKGEPDLDKYILSYAVSDSVEVTEPRPASVPYEQSAKSDRTYARITTGIDVSAAASADPAAHFMADLSFDVPFSNRDSSLYNKFSSSGYLRLASIAQPGAINGIATPATYIKPLTDSTPNNLVQSWEGNVAFDWNLNKRLYLGEQSAYWTTSAIVDGGFITPISASQTSTTPTVYIANKAIYDYYTTAPVPSAAASKAITDACVIPASGIFPTCYVAYIPQDRTRFFRNYGAGVTFKRYPYQGNDNGNKRADKFDFPGTATIKIGQNEYVTKGQARGLVLHGDVFWPIPGILGGKWQGTLYVFGQIDTHLSKNESSQQFILPTAGSAITRTSPNVAIIPVQQPDRDRYRFGVAVDLTTLIKAISAVAAPK